MSGWTYCLPTFNAAAATAVAAAAAGFKDTSPDLHGADYWREMHLLKMDCGALVCLPQVLQGDSQCAVEDIATEEYSDLRPQMLLVNAMPHRGPGRARLVEMLLQRGARDLEETYPDSGETPLSIAARIGDAEVLPWVVQLTLFHVWLYQCTNYAMCPESSQLGN
jgi:hypothetical protein